MHAKYKHGICVLVIIWDQYFKTKNVEFSKDLNMHLDFRT